MIYGGCLMSQNHMSQSNNLAQSKSGLVLQQFPYDTFGEAEPYVCEARMYRSLVLTDFHMLRESKFGFARKMLYLCRALGKCSASVGWLCECGLRLSIARASSALRSPCTTLAPSIMRDNKREAATRCSWSHRNLIPCKTQQDYERILS